MKTSTVIAGLATILSSAEGLTLHKREDGPPKVVSMETQRKTFKDPARRDRLRRRAATVQATLDNEVSVYPPLPPHKSIP